VESSESVRRNSLIQVPLIGIIIVIIIILIAIFLSATAFVRFDGFLMTKTLRAHPHLILISYWHVALRVFITINLQLFLCVLPCRASSLHGVLLVETPAILGLLSAIEQTPTFELVIVLVLSCILYYLREIVSDSRTGLVGEGS